MLNDLLEENGLRFAGDDLQRGEKVASAYAIAIVAGMLLHT